MFYLLIDALEIAVRGMMYYRRALMLQSYMERRSLGGIYTLKASELPYYCFLVKAWTYCYYVTYLFCFLSG